jgi:hypothetical protein
MASRLGVGFRWGRLDSNRAEADNVGLSPVRRTVVAILPLATPRNASKTCAGYGLEHPQAMRLIPRTSHQYSIVVQ